MTVDARVLGSVLVIATCATLAGVDARAAQGQPSGAQTAQRVELEGFVLMPDGSPADGAVVVSSAGE
jgi:hypothetical protein